MRFAKLVTAVAALATGGAARAACSVSTSGVAFGAYSFLSPAPLDSAGEVWVTCHAGVRYTLRLDSGQQPEAAWRAMSSARAAGARLRYQLFRDPGRREVWGDGAGNAFLHVGLGSGGTQRVRVFGRIPPRQPVPAGTYADTITLTVEW